MDFEKTLKVNLLLDFYAALLTEKQSETMNLYFKEDYSLSEIANEFGISRNAVYDQIQKAMKQLEQVEEKLELVQRFEKREELYEEMKRTFNNERMNEFIERLKQLD